MEDDKSRDQNSGVCNVPTGNYLNKKNNKWKSNFIILLFPTARKLKKLFDMLKIK